MTDKIDFFQEVIILKSENHPDFVGRKGVVLGISEDFDEQGRIKYGYATTVEGAKHVYSFEADQLEPTGIFFKREDFY